MHSLEGFGNARDVDAVWKATKRYRADRLMRSNAAGKQFEESDLQQAVDELIKGRSLAKGKKSMVKRAVQSEPLSPQLKPNPLLGIMERPRSGAWPARRCRSWLPSHSRARAGERSAAGRGSKGP